MNTMLPKSGSPYPWVSGEGGGAVETTGNSALPFIPAAVMPSFDEVMHNLRNAARTSCLLPRYAAEKIADSRTERHAAAIKSWDNFAGMGLDELHSRVQEIEAAVVGAASRNWTRMARNLEDIFHQFDVGMKKLDEHWEGKVADYVTKDTAQLIAGSDHVVNAATAIAYNLDNLASAIDHTKTSVPPPPKPSIYDDVADWFDDRNTHAYDAAKQQAVAALHEVYQPGLAAADTPPLIPNPHNPIAAAPSTATQAQPGATHGGGAGGLGAAATTGPSSAESVGGPNTHGPQSASAGDGQHTAADNGPGTGNGNAHGPSSAAAASTDPSHTTAAAVDPTAGGDSISPGGFGSTDGVPGGSIGDQGGLGGGLLQNPLGGGPTGAARPGGVACDAGAAGRSPAAGMPGMPGVGGRGRGDEKEHKSPSYLVNVDNGNKLIGLLDKASPPVIGVWNDDGTHKSD